MSSPKKIAEFAGVRPPRFPSTFEALVNSVAGDDVGAQNNMQRLFERETRPTYDEIETLVARWSRYQGLVYFHLLLEKLRAKGML